MIRRSLLIALLIFTLSSFANAQFNSGSTGADGPLDLTTMTCPNNICEVQLPESGILNYTSVNIPADKVLRFKFNSRNTPVIMLATGNIMIAGSLQVMLPRSYSNISATIPGPGGFYGGSSSAAGLGPGGGQSPPGDPHGRWVGNLSLVPIIGGSGGYSGCGGGGAIAIASSTTIFIAGSINADSVTNGQAFCVGSGSGGAVRLVANTLNINGTVFARGDVNNGIIRFEAPTGQINFSGTAIPTAIFSTINSIIVPSNPPTLTIASIGGYAVPAYSAGRPDRVDLMLPTQLADPLSIVIQGTNVPAGTPVQLQLSASSGTVTGCTLTGSPGPVSCNASVSGLNRNGVSTLLAVATFTPPSVAQAFNPKGQNQVAKIRLEAGLNSNSKFIFLRNDGTAIDPKSLSPQFLQQFGM